MKTLPLVFLGFLIISSCKKDEKDAIVPVESISFPSSSTPLQLKVGETSSPLAPTILPANASDKSIEWKSSDATVATVSKDGVVTGVKAGLATITAKSKSTPSKTATCAVAVIVPATSIRINPDRASVLVNGDLPLEVIFTPANATDNLTWTSSDEGKATVSATGRVTGIAVGAVTITATSATNAQITATCQVTVTTTAVAVTGVTLETTTLGLVLGGQPHTLIKTITPDNATNQGVTYVSDRPNIATVSDAGVITAIAVGTATITVTTADGNKTATCAVTVTLQEVPATGISINPAEAPVIMGGELQLQVIFTPANATDNVTWTSSDEGKATVSATGLVRGIAVGAVTITARSARNANIQATCTVTVFIPVSTITLASNPTALTVGGTAQVTPTVAPENASNKAVTWSSSDPSKATVDNNGLVTGIARGSVTITATAADGSAVKGEITFTVKSADATISAITLGAENFIVAIPAEGATTTITNAPRTVFSDPSAVRVNITAADGATIKIATEDFTSGQTANFANAVTFTVTAEDGTTDKTYTVAITAYNAATNPYGIYTANHLADVKNGLSANFLLKNAIDLPNATAQGAADATDVSDYAEKGWLPLGPFTGTFDGGSFSINNFYANRAAGKVGLFGEIGSGGTIRNLGVNGVSGTAVTVNGGSNVYCYTGILAGFSFGTIDKCYATGNVSASTSGGLSNTYAGGLVGYSESASAISNSYATGNASASTGFSTSCAGGLAGYSDGAISNSYATGNASASSVSSYAGGLAGLVGNKTISNSYATGSVSVSASVATAIVAIGGFVGSGTLATSSTPATSYTNCFCNSEATLTVTRNGITTTPDDATRIGITAKTIAEMRADAFLTLLNAGSTVWGRDGAKNNGGLPFIIGVGVGRP